MVSQGPEKPAWGVGEKKSVEHEASDEPGEEERPEPQGKGKGKGKGIDRGKGDKGKGKVKEVCALY